MGVIPAFGDPPPDDAIQAAAHALLAGNVVAIPTDTVYGLAALPAHVDRLFDVKRRPPDVEVPLLVLEAIVREFDGPLPRERNARRLMHAFWPGALTIVVPKGSGGTIGLRCPDHPVPLALLELVGEGIAATSANLHGEPTPATADEIAELFGNDVAVVLDGGRCEGSPSTVVDCTGDEPRLIREGRVPWDEVLVAARG